MTPRQLMALSDQHRELHASATEGQPVQTRRRRPVDNRGSAGWLMAVANDLNRQHAARQSSDSGGSDGATA